jgi:hypothetical protein
MPMNKILRELDMLYSDTRKDPALRERLLATRSAEDPMDSFCQIACEAGRNITVGDLFAVGLEYSDNQCKSQNGGNQYPYQGFQDIYETFLASL